MTTSVTCRVEVGLLGPFTLRVGGRQVRSDVWKSKKALTLLKYLASIHGRRVSSDALIELLWPDQINVDIQRNLHTAIWFARRILLPEESPTAESPLRYSHGSYWLDLGGTCIDVALFESHATRSRELEATNREMAPIVKPPSRCIGMTFSARISMKNGPSPTGTSTVSSTSK